MKQVLLIDFGSTYTKVTAVDIEKQELLGTAASYTTVQSDINCGLENALKILSEKIGNIDYDARYACSSAAGGLKMVACGLVPELTAEAAKQASLGAGAKVMKVFSYQLIEDDADEIAELKPDIFLLTGGTDGGNKDIIIENAKIVASIPLDFPVVIAGNRTAARTCERIIAESGKQAIVCENVMPKFNQLNIQPAQEKIREVFLERIIKAKGLSAANKLISGIMKPTPAAVLSAMELLSKGTEKEKGIGDLVAVDVGGATTDVYSMSYGEPDKVNTVIKGLPEPYGKRTVEGDIGMRYSATGIVEAVGIGTVARLSGLSTKRVEELVGIITSRTDTLPDSEDVEKMDFALASMAVKVGMTRHAGFVEKVYTPVGETFLQTGKDLSKVEKVIITGGSLIHSADVKDIAAHALYDPSEPTSLKPMKAEILVDKSYILSAMGLLSEYDADTALKIMKKELLSYGTSE